MAEGVLRGWIGLRTRIRGLSLPLFASPLIPAALLGALGGDESIVLGSALGFGASVLAARVARRGHKGDGDRAAAIMGVGTGLAAWLAAGMGVISPFVVAAGAFFGTRMSFRALPETPPPPPPAPPAARRVCRRARRRTVCRTGKARAVRRRRVVRRSVKARRVVRRARR